MYIGIRSGGGIGDELESPVGDSKEFFRIIFDITFFFFIIVILLAIIQGKWTFLAYIYWVLNIFKQLIRIQILGLIIDAFGELRDQLEQVKESLEVCVIISTFFTNQFPF